jgi:hypothetical protein
MVTKLRLPPFEPIAAITCFTRSRDTFFGMRPIVPPHRLGKSVSL